MNDGNISVAHSCLAACDQQLPPPTTLPPPPSTHPPLRRQPTLAPPHACSSAALWMHLICINKWMDGVCYWRLAFFLFPSCRHILMNSGHREERKSEAKLNLFLFFFLTRRRNFVILCALASAGCVSAIFPPFSSPVFLQKINPFSDFLDFLQCLIHN